MALILCFVDQPHDDDTSETSSVDADEEVETVPYDSGHDTELTSEESDEESESDGDYDLGITTPPDGSIDGNLSADETDSDELEDQFLPTHLESSYEDEEEELYRQELIASDLKDLRPDSPYVVVMPLPASDSRWDFRLETLYRQIRFNDGHSWYIVLRLGNEILDFDNEVIQKAGQPSRPRHPRGMVESEVLSMQAMKKAGIALVANTYLPKGDGVMARIIGSAHFYCDVMPGSQCPPDLFPVDYFARTQEIPTDPISRKILLKSFIESYADHQIQLSRLRFESISRLEYSEDGEVVEGPIFIDDHPILTKRRSGPFKSLGAFHIARIDYLLHALRYSRFEDGREWTFDERNRYLTLLECKKWMKMSKWLNKDRFDFYLRHQLDCLSNYLVKDGKLSAVLQWQGAYSTIKEEAFGSPQFMRSRTSSVRDCLNSELSESENLLIKAYLARGRGDLAGCVEGAKIYRALWQIPEAISEVYRFKKLLQVDDGVLLPLCRYEWLSNLASVDHRDDDGVVEERARRALSVGQPV